jgi:hypothetical protein
VHAAVKATGCEIFAVITRAARKAFPTPYAYSKRPAGHARSRVGGSKAADQAGAAQAGQMERACVVGDDSIAGIANA